MAHNPNRVAAVVASVMASVVVASAQVVEDHTVSPSNQHCHCHSRYRQLSEAVGAHQPFWMC
jgi:hypothetical protein